MFDKIKKMLASTKPQDDTEPSNEGIVLPVPPEYATETYPVIDVDDSENIDAGEVEVEGEGYLGYLTFSQDAIFLDPCQIDRPVGPDEDYSLPIRGVWDVWVSGGDTGNYDEVRITPQDAGDLDDEFMDALTSSINHTLLTKGEIAVDTGAILVSDSSMTPLLNYDRDVVGMENAAHIVEGGLVFSTGGNGSFPVSVLINNQGDTIGVLITVYGDANDD